MKRLIPSPNTQENQRLRSLVRNAFFEGADARASCDSFAEWIMESEYIWMQSTAHDALFEGED